MTTKSFIVKTASLIRKQPNKLDEKEVNKVLSDLMKEGLVIQTKKGNYELTYKGKTSASKNLPIDYSFIKGFVKKAQENK